MNEKNVVIAGQNAANLHNFIVAHNNNVSSDGMRLGQRFVNIYISKPWPELFYEKSDKKALSIIEQWLEKHHYFNEMPPLAKRNK